MRIKEKNPVGQTENFLFGYTSTNLADRCSGFHDNVNNSFFSYKSGGGATSVSTNWIMDTYHNVKIIRDLSTPQIRWYEDTTEKTGSPFTTSNNIATANLVIVYYVGYVSTLYVDWVFVRKFASPEPIFSTIGTEETVTCGTPSANLIVLEILSEQLSRPYPSYVDIDIISKMLDSYK
jgi:hypothetical protein